MAEETRLSKWKPEEIEENRKKINRILKDGCGKDVLGAMLGMEFEEAPDLSGKPHIQVLIPTYKGYDPDMEAAAREMFKYTRQFCTLDVPGGMPHGIIHWARNQLVAPLYKEKKKFTHVLFMDDDMVPEKDAIVRLLRHEKDVVGALCSHRNDPPVPNMRRFEPTTNEWFNVFQWDTDALCGESGIVGVGGGMILATKHAMDSIAEYYVSCEFEKQLWSPSIDKLEEMRAKRRKFFEDSGNAYWFEFLKAPNGQGEYGEDISFSYKANHCGLKVYVDTSIQPGHMGRYSYGVKDFMPFQENMVRAAKMAGWDCVLREGEDEIPDSDLQTTELCP